MVGDSTRRGQKFEDPLIGIQRAPLPLIAPVLGLAADEVASGVAVQAEPSQMFFCQFTSV